MKKNNVVVGFDVEFECKLDWIIDKFGIWLFFLVVGVIFLFGFILELNLY